jgi:hypothetical protein
MSRQGCLFSQKKSGTTMMNPGIEHQQQQKKEYLTKVTSDKTKKREK